MGGRIEKILIKYFSRSASIEELIELTEWLKANTNDFTFNHFVKLNYLIDAGMLDFDTDKEIDKILEQITVKEKKTRKLKIFNLFKYAAVLIIALSIGSYLFLKDESVLNEEIKTVTEVGSKVKPGIDKAVLTLDDGTTVELGRGAAYKTQNVNSNGKEIIYKKTNNDKGVKRYYNYLTIPRGGQFHVKLSDGTHIWLNSESKLKYPVNFRKGMTREVELVYGEAYFDVSSSKQQGGEKFMVRSGSQKIEVLGTEFNIKAYKSESHIVTTLVEGSVKIENNSKSIFLKPSEQSIIDEDGGINVVKVHRVFDEIAWKEGYFSFKQKTVEEIMKTLSRWYDVDYQFKNAEAKNKSFTGVLDREETIGHILTLIQRTNEIQYKIEENTVIIE